MGNEYGSSNIKVLKGLEAVRKRPGMYIGDTNTGGLHHMVYEVVDNSIDESLAGHCNFISIKLTKDNFIEVTDNGRGIPVDIHPTEKIPTLTVVLTVLHAGGKFDKDTYKVSGGLHGVGVSVVNALSDYLEAIVKRDGNIYRQTFSKGIPTSQMEVIGKTTERGTTIRFHADNEIMEVIEFNADILRRRFKEMAYLNKNITIEFIDEKSGTTDKFHFEGGLAEYVLDLNKRPLLTSVISMDIQGENIDGELSLAYNDGYDEKVLSFVNNIRTPDGGTHEAGFKMGLSRAISNYLEKNATGREKDIKITGDDVREGLVGVVSVKLPEPQFEGQTKSKLGSSYVKGIVQKLVYEKLTKFFEENPIQARAIMQKALLAARGREAAKRARDLTRKVEKASIGTLPGKLADCTYKDPQVCELYLVEGDSAGGSAKSGRDRYFQAILPLKGKILNVEKSMLDKVLKSEEVKNIITAIGTGIGSEFQFDKARYNKIIIMTDADVDGAHIQTLLLTFFYRYFKPLIEAGYVYLALPPLYRFERKGRFGGVVYLRDEAELEQHLVNLGLAEIQNSEDKSIYPPLIDNNIDKTKQVLSEIQYFKHIVSDLQHMFQLPELVEVILDGIEKNVPSIELILDIVRAFENSWNVSVYENVDVDGVKKTIRTKSCNILHIHNDKTSGQTYVKLQVPKGIVEFVLHPDMFGKDSLFHTCHKIMKEIKKNKFGGYTPFEYLNVISNLARKGSYIQRYKGLGEMNPDQLWETAMNPENRRLLRITIDSHEAADSVLNLFMGSEVEPRKEYIMQNSKNVKNLDV